jgi:hypothetical protein
MSEGVSGMRGRTSAHPLAYNDPTANPGKEPDIRSATICEELGKQFDS